MARWAGAAAAEPAAWDAGLVGDAPSGGACGRGCDGPGVGACAGAGAGAAADRGSPAGIVRTELKAELERQAATFEGRLRRVDETVRELADLVRHLAQAAHDSGPLAKQVGALGAEVARVREAQAQGAEEARAAARAELHAALGPHALAELRRQLRELDTEIQQLHARDQAQAEQLQALLRADASAALDARRHRHLGLAEGDGTASRESLDLRRRVEGLEDECAHRAAARDAPLPRAELEDLRCRLSAHEAEVAQLREREARRPDGAWAVREVVEQALAAHKADFMAAFGRQAAAARARLELDQAAARRDAGLQQQARHEAQRKRSEALADAGPGLQLCLGAWEAQLGGGWGAVGVAPQRPAAPAGAGPSCEGAEGASPTAEEAAVCDELVALANAAGEATRCRLQDLREHILEEADASQRRQAILADRFGERLAVVETGVSEEELRARIDALLGAGLGAGLGAELLAELGARADAQADELRDSLGEWLRRMAEATRQELVTFLDVRLQHAVQACDVAERSASDEQVGAAGGRRAGEEAAARRQAEPDEALALLGALDARLGTLEDRVAKSLGGVAAQAEGVLQDLIQDERAARGRLGADLGRRLAAVEEVVPAQIGELAEQIRHAAAQLRDQAAGARALGGELATVQERLQDLEYVGEGGGSAWRGQRGERSRSGSQMEDEDREESVQGGQLAREVGAWARRHVELAAQVAALQRRLENAATESQDVSCADDVSQGDEERSCIGKPTLSSESRRISALEARLEARTTRQAAQPAMRPAPPEPYTEASRPARSKGAAPAEPPWFAPVASSGPVEAEPLAEAAPASTGGTGEWRGLLQELIRDARQPARAAAAAQSPDRGARGAHGWTGSARPAAWPPAWPAAAGSGGGLPGL